MNPLISIIIPTFNRAHLIGETLDSIIAQTYSNWECIVVDDGSSDNTEEVLAKYINKDQRFQYHQRPTNRQKGANACRNYGFEICKGNYVKWFDSDDVMLPQLLRLQMDSFTSTADSSICKVTLFDFEKKRELKTNIIFSNNLIQDYFIGKIVFYICGPLWRYSFLTKQSVLFDESISNLDDWDFNLRMLYNNPEIIFLHESLIKYRRHSTSLSHEIGKLNFIEIKSELRARNKHLNLLKRTKLVNQNILKNYIKERYRFFLRESLIQKIHSNHYLIKKLLFAQMSSADLKGFAKTIVGFATYRIFNRGYKFLK